MPSAVSGQIDIPLRMLEDNSNELPDRPSQTKSVFRKAMESAESFFASVPKHINKRNALYGLATLGALAIPVGTAGGWFNGRKTGFEAGEQLQCGDDIPKICNHLDSLFNISQTESGMNPNPVSYCIFQAIDQCGDKAVNDSLPQKGNGSNGLGDTEWGCIPNCAYKDNLYKVQEILSEQISELVRKNSSAPAGGNVV